MRIPKPEIRTNVALSVYFVALVISYKQELKDYLQHTNKNNGKTKNINTKPILHYEKNL